MKKTVLALIGCVAVLVLAIAPSPIVRDELDWRWASHKDKAEDYATYLKCWPSGRHVAEARKLYEQRSWSDAKGTNAIQSFEAYIRDHPEGKYVSEAKDMIDTLLWEKANDENTAASYQHYIDAQPLGRFVDEAKDLYEQRIWSDAKSANTVESFEAYIRDHPEGKYVSEAKNMIDTLLWEKANDENTAASYQHYIDVQPSGRFAEEAKRLYEQRIWSDAKSANTIQSFEAYIRDHPEGEYVSEAKNMIDTLLWKKAEAENTVVSYQQYIDAQPFGRFVEEARSKKKSLVDDDSPYLAAKDQGTREAYETFLAHFPGHKREGDARKVLEDMAGRDIVDLLQERKIQARASGSGIEEVKLELKLDVEYKVAVRIPVGTFFVCSSAQNMVVTREKTVVLEDDDWESVSIDVTCANRTRDIPYGDDEFKIERSPKQEELQKLMPVLRAANVAFAVRQAAVWIVTDNADYDDLGSLVSRTQFQAFGGTRIVREYEAAKAMKICQQAGIEIKKKAIWQERDRIIKGLSDTDLKEWLQDKNGK